MDNLLQDGRVEMDIGQHFLEGNVVQLKTAFLIVEKHKLDQDLSDVGGSRPMTIEGYVKTKIIFKTRPKPIGLKRVLK